MNDIFIRLLDLPEFVKGQTLLDPDGNYNIYINARLPCDVQKDTLKHELAHINNDDFNKDLPIEIAEKRISKCR